MGTNQDLHQLRACLERAHSDLRAAAKHAYDANRGAALTDAALRRVTALIEKATDCIVDASTTLRAESLGATPAPARVPRPLSRPLAEPSRAPRPCVTCGCASFDECMRCGAPLCDGDCALVHVTETKGSWCQRPES